MKRRHERQANRIQRPATSYAAGLQIMFFELESNLLPSYTSATAYPRYYVETYPAGQDANHPGFLETDLSRTVMVWDHTGKHYGTGRNSLGPNAPKDAHGDFGAAIKYPGSPLWYIIDLPQYTAYYY